jgi:hypothetical protein
LKSLQGDSALSAGARSENAWTKKSFTPHDIEDVNAITVLPIEHSAGGLNDLPVSPTLEFLWLGAASGMIRQLLLVFEDTLHQLLSSLWILQRDVVCDGIQIVEGRLSPDYLSHLAMRRLA